MPDNQTTQPEEIWWTWDYDMDEEDSSEFRRVLYLLPNETEPQELTSPSPEIRAEWDIPTIDGIDAERDIVCEVVNMMWVIGLGNPNMLCSIRYISREGMDNIIAFRVEKRRPYIGWDGHEYYEI